MKKIEPHEAYNAMEEMYRSAPLDLLSSGDWGFLVSPSFAKSLLNYVGQFSTLSPPAEAEIKSGFEFKWRGVKCRVI